MKIYQILVYKNMSQYLKVENLSDFGFLYKNSIRSTMLDYSVRLAEETEVNKMKLIEYDINFKTDDNIKVYNMFSVCEQLNSSKDIYTIVMVVNNDYKIRYVYSLSQKVLDIFRIPSIKKEHKLKLEKLFKNSKDTYTYDKIDEVNNLLDENIKQVEETIEKIIERGTSIDDLLIETEKLKYTSIDFKRTSVNANRCCTFM